MSIAYKQNDKYLVEIIEDIKRTPVYRYISSLPNRRTLYVHGVSSSRDIDIVISNSINNANEIRNKFREMGYSTETGILINNGNLYNNLILGLGLNIRKDRKEFAKRVILAVYAATNNKITL